MYNLHFILTPSYNLAKYGNNNRIKKKKKQCQKCADSDYRLYEYILTVGVFFISSAVGLLIGAFLGLPFFC